MQNTNSEWNFSHNHIEHDPWAEHWKWLRRSSDQLVRTPENLEKWI